MENLTPFENHILSVLVSDEQDKKGMGYPCENTMVNSWVEEIMDNICEIVCTNIEEPAGRGCGYGIRVEGCRDLENYLFDFLEKKLLTHVKRYSINVT